MGKPYIDFAALKASVSMTQVLEHYGLMAQMRPIKNGEGLEGPCPIHKGTGPDQFKVSTTKNCWNCFSECKCGGNVLDFVARMENVDVHEAAVRVNDWFKLGLGQSPPTERSNRSRDGDAPKPSVSGNGNGNGTSKPPPASPPEDESSENAGRNEPLKFELQNLKTDHGYFKERGLTPATVAEFGLGYCSKGTMAGRVVVPIHNRDSALVGYVGRWPGEAPEERPKYKLPNGFKKSAEVFNLHRTINESAELPLIVVEGFFDVMKLWQLGYRQVVSLMGSTLSKQQEELLVTAVGKKSGIILLFDEDDAGRAGRDKALARLSRRTFVRVVVLPREGAQPDHLTAEELHALLS